MCRGDKHGVQECLHSSTLPLLFPLFLFLIQGTERGESDQLISKASSLDSASLVPSSCSSLSTVHVPVPACRWRRDTTEAQGLRKLIVQFKPQDFLPFPTFLRHGILLCSTGRKREWLAKNVQSWQRRDLNSERLVRRPISQPLVTPAPERGVEPNQHPDSVHVFFFFNEPEQNPNCKPLVCLQLNQPPKCLTGQTGQKLVV